MTIELTMLAWGCLLAFVHIFAAAHARTRQYGAKWNMGPRDEELAPANPLVGRLARAQTNFFETFPIMAAAILIVAVTGSGNQWTQLGALLWLGARALYLPLYALGIPVARSIVFLVSVIGILLVLAPMLVSPLFA